MTMYLYVFMSMSVTMAMFVGINLKHHFCMNSVPRYKLYVE